MLFISTRATLLQRYLNAYNNDVASIELFFFHLDFVSTSKRLHASIMLAVSHLLNVPVFCFLELVQRWQRLAPNNVDRILLESEPGEMAIYMYHPCDHFDVVMSV